MRVRWRAGGWGGITTLDDLGKLNALVRAIKQTVAGTTRGGGRSTALSLPKEAGQTVSVGSDMHLESAAAATNAARAAIRLG